ncbi:hypothetical protein, partial [Sphingomonas turrisvirgatae]|uniref:hypothetical protein n=1 Tax=Sphingomonas turrisvirgatae TaxID=1888892 RepID=UPI0019D346A8
PNCGHSTDPPSIPEAAVRSSRQPRRTGRLILVQNQAGSFWAADRAERIFVQAGRFETTYNSRGNSIGNTAGDTRLERHSLSDQLVAAASQRLPLR